jgi:all-trans-retinol dehydrogenase (NAD+)
MRSLEDQVVVITGGGSGIGRLLSLEFAKKGSIVVIIDLFESTAKAVAKECLDVGMGKSYHAYQCDVSNRDTIYKVCDEIKSKIGKV